MTILARITLLLGRILLALIFLVSGFGKIGGWEQTAGYMASKGMPLIPLFLFAAIAIEIGGGLFVLTGRMARVGALALVVFLIPTTLIFHNFWAMEGMERQLNMVMFMKNLAIMGGLLMVAAYEAGPFRIDNRRKEI